MAPLRILVMGVSGSGKTTFGRALAQRLGLQYCDGDDLHAPASIAKMAAGLPLQDADRWPWLARIGSLLHDQAPVIVGCSALKRSYRDLLRRRAGGPLTLIHLHGPREVLLARMRHRSSHFMPESLLDSQLATLEPPQSYEQPITLALDQSLADQLAQAVTALAAADRKHR